MKNIFVFILLCLASKIFAFPVAQKIKSIPLPPLGQRWVLNEDFSDEFSANKLDSNKWHNKHPEWIGRAPGLFIEENISLKDGFLRLKGSKLKEKQEIFKYGKDLVFEIGGAAVVSKSKEAHYGYYECRVKANKTTMSTTFWLSTRGSFPTENRQPEASAKGIFSQELDILECVGRKGDFSGAKFADGMNCNAHYWFTKDKGTKEDIRAEGFQLKRADSKMPSEDFNVYGCWWVDKTKAKFYLNNEENNEIIFQNKQTKEPFYFTEPMSLLMVVETYPFPWIELPNDEELNDDTKNTSIYDWVRAYKLVDINEKSSAKNTVFENNINFIEQMSADEFSFNIAYTACENSYIELEIHSKSKKLLSKKFNALSGFGNNLYSIEKSKFAESLAYKAVVYLKYRDKVLAVDSIDLK